MMQMCMPSLQVLVHLHAQGQQRPGKSTLHQYQTGHLPGNRHDACTHLPRPLL